MRVYGTAYWLSGKGVLNIWLTAQVHGYGEIVKHKEGYATRHKISNDHRATLELHRGQRTGKPYMILTVQPKSATGWFEPEGLHTNQVTAMALLGQLVPDWDDPDKKVRFRPLTGIHGKVISDRT